MKLFYGGGGVGWGGGELSKNFGHHGWPTAKNLKKHTGWKALKQSPK